MAFQFAGALFNAAVSFALALYLARAFGPAEYGHYTAVLGAAVIGLILVEAGWPTLVYRESVDASGATAGRRLASWGLAHALVAGSTLAVGAAILGAPGLAAAMACMTLVGLMNLVSGRLRGAGLFGREALFQSGARLASASAIVAAVAFLGAQVGTVFHAWALALLPVLFWGAAGQLPTPALPTRSGYGLALRFAALEGLMALVMKSDVALLEVSGLHGEALSRYAACTRLNEAALLLCASFANVAIRKARLLASEPAALRRFARGALVGCFAAGSVAWLGAVCLGVPLMRALFGDAYAEAGDLLPWTAAMLPFALANLVSIPLAVARGAERPLVHALAFGAGVLALSLTLGLHLGGTTGAAAGLAVGQAFLLAVLLRVLRQRSAA